MRCARVVPGRHAVDLGKLLHQAAVGVEPSRGVDQHDIGAAGPGRGDRVEGDRGRVAAGLTPDEVRPCALGPPLELLDRARAEGIRRGHHGPTATGGQLVGQLADGGRLADAVHAHHEVDRRGNVGHGQPIRGVGDPVAVEDIADRAAQDPPEPRLVARRPLARRLLDHVDEAHGGLDAEVGHDKAFLQILEHVGVDPAECRRDHPA